MDVRTKTDGLVGGYFALSCRGMTFLGISARTDVAILPSRNSGSQHAERFPISSYKDSIFLLISSRGTPSSVMHFVWGIQSCPAEISPGLSSEYAASEVEEGSLLSDFSLRVLSVLRTVMFFGFFARAITRVLIV